MIARHAPFIDDNPRAGFMAMVTVSCTRLNATENDAMLAMASGELTEDGFIGWVREYTSPD